MSMTSPYEMSNSLTQRFVTANETGQQKSCNFLIRNNVAGLRLHGHGSCVGRVQLALKNNQ